MKYLLITISLVFLTGCVSAFEPAERLPIKPLPASADIERIAVGSCFTTADVDTIFAKIAAGNPDVFMMIGDNVYAEDESEDPELMSLREAYAGYVGAKHFMRLVENTPFLVTWDDHDYGLNDAGTEFAGKAKAEAIYEHVWNVTDERASRDGVYYSRIAGPEGRRVQFILLDTRYFRTALTMNPEEGGHRYLPSADPQQSILGETQWQWLEEELRKPADLRVVVTSIQMIADGHGWEAWRLMPKERQRFYDLVGETGAGGVVLISGDRHAGSIYKIEGKTPYPMYELTASSLNIPLTTFVKNPTPEPGPYRLGDPYFESNFGTVDIDWAKGDVTLALRNELGQPVRSTSFSLEDLN